MLDSLPGFDHIHKEHVNSIRIFIDCSAGKIVADITRNCQKAFNLL